MSRMTITCFLAATIFFWPLALPASTVATVAIAPLPNDDDHDHGGDNGGDDHISDGVPGLDYYCQWCLTGQISVLRIFHAVN